MKFKNENGAIFSPDGLDFCGVHGAFPCKECPMYKHVRPGYDTCKEFAQRNPEKAALIMGYELVMDENDSISEFHPNADAVEMDEFERLFEEQVQRSREVLCQKEKEYATDDKFHTFRVAGALQGITMRQALAGMMAKHTASVYDMCCSKQKYSLELWQEKITDHISYLFILNAMIRSEEGEQ